MSQAAQQWDGVSSGSLHTHGHAHPPSHAECGHTPPATSPLQSVQERDQDAAPRHAQGVAQRDGTATDVHLQGEPVSKLASANWD